MIGIGEHRKLCRSLAVEPYCNCCYRIKKKEFERIASAHRKLVKGLEFYAIKRRYPQYKDEKVVEDYSESIIRKARQTLEEVERMMDGRQDA